MSPSAFDSIAASYDAEFTHTLTGRLQRDRVYAILSELLGEGAGKKVLELNCGTGEDAVWLAQSGCEVLATDIAEGMIAIAREKQGTLPAEFSNKLQFQTLAAESISLLPKDHSFDLVFSNFGGLNCLSPEQLAQVAKGAEGKLRAKGLMIAVVMGRKCIWETFYFLLKRQWKKAWRRRSQTPIAARLSDEVQVMTWYYSPSEFSRLFAEQFQVLTAYPIGIAIPPSYLDPFFRSRPTWLKGLQWLEQKLGRKAGLANYADHFLIVLQKRK